MHSSPVLRRLTVAAGCAVLAVGLTGCTKLADPTGGLAVVVGARSNMPQPTLDGAASDALDAAIDAQSDLAVVVADGAPSVYEKGSLIIEGKNGPAQDASKARNRAMVVRALADAAAVAPETDLLAALDLGARSVADTDGAHTVVVVDSGLSTVAPLDFTQPGLLDADPTELVAALQAAGELPDLTGDDVLFSGLGDTADPQPRLTSGQRQNLVTLWKAIAVAAGADSVEVVQSPLTGDAPVNRPPVTVVALPPATTCTGGTVTLSGGDVAFVPDSAEFLDPAAASAVVGPIAQQLLEDGLTATVTGMTADVGSSPGQVALSKARAQAVADVLTAAGVPAASLTVVGLGSDFPGYVQDHDATGTLIPAAAAANRKVEIAPAGGSTPLACTGV